MKHESRGPGAYRRNAERLPCEIRLRSETQESRSMLVEAAAIRAGRHTDRTAPEQLPMTAIICESVAFRH